MVCGQYGVVPVLLRVYEEDGGEGEAEAEVKVGGRSEGVGNLKAAESGRIFPHRKSSD